MAKTLSQILLDANSFLDLTYELPTGDELSTRVNYANQAVFDAAAIGQFPEFSTVYSVNPSGMASISLPTGFSELESSPYQYLSSGEYNRFNVIKPHEQFTMNADDPYCYILGNSAVGYTAVFNGLTANATLSFPYQRSPSGMATLSDICELSDPQYVVSKIESYVLQARSDDRFPIIEADAQRRLQNMLGRSSKLITNETRKRSTSAYDPGYQ